MSCTAVRSLLRRQPARPVCTSYRQITSRRTLCDQLQPFTSAQTNPTPDLTLPLPLTLITTFGGLEVGRGSRAAPPPRVLVALFQKESVGPKTQSRPVRSASCRRSFGGSSCRQGAPRQPGFAESSLHTRVAIIIEYHGCQQHPSPTAAMPCQRDQTLHSTSNSSKYSTSRTDGSAWSITTS